MSSTKTIDVESSLVGVEQKSSKDILNELFGSFNTSFDEDSVLEDDSGSKKKKKSKKAKKSKNKDKKGGSSHSEDGSNSPSPKKGHKKNRKEKDGDKNGQDVDKSKDKKNRKRRRSPAGEDEDVNELIHKHRKNVRNQFKGLVSNIGDIVIKNDELIKSKSKKREEDIRKAGGNVDVEDGEIFEDDRRKDFDFKTLQSKKKHKKPKLSASQAYKLDMEEKVLLGMEPVIRSKSIQHKSPKDEKSSHSRLRPSSQHSSSNGDRDRRHSHSGVEEHTSGSFNETSHHRDRKKSGEIEATAAASRVIRQAPPRTPPHPIPSPAYDRDRDREREREHSSSRSNNYKDTVWQKERDHYEAESYTRRRDRDYNYENVYQKETNRRSDGRSGFGFVSRSYYDDPVAQGGDKRSHHDDHGGGRSRSPGVSRSRSFRRSRSRSPPRWRRSRSRSSERRRRHPDDIIDKAKLLEIARKNAAKLMRRGVMPSDIFSRDQIVAIRAGGKSVDELTEYCKRIARKDARGDALSEESEGEDQFIHHPFHVKDRPLPQITLNIRNAIPLPVRTPMELAIEGAKLKTVFPVSSGCQHRIKELEWHPVDKEEEEKKAKAAEAASKALVPLDGTNVEVPPASENNGETALAIIGDSNASSTNKSSEIQLKEPAPPEFDISDVIAIRLKAMRQISENPDSTDAKKNLEDATKMMKRWADSKALEPKFLSQSELTQGPQAWAKRDQLTKAKEVQSPMGLHLLQKMGWKPGEGLGKCKSGDIEPLALEVKTDKKGLTSVLDYKKGPAMPLVFDLSGKHPISSLMELCAKRKWGAPEFDLVFEHGPPHKKQFVYKVVVNGVEYQPCIAVNNKKLAKANAAAFCLQSLGLLPTSQAPESSETLQTVVPTPVPPPIPTESGPSALGRFTPSSHYLQTVPSTPAAMAQPPLPADVLMPPPPPPPPLKLIKK